MAAMRAPDRASTQVARRAPPTLSAREHAGGAGGVDRGRTGGGAELGEDRRDVVLDRALGEVQRSRDVGVGGARRHVLEHLLLAPGEAGRVRERRPARTAQRRGSVQRAVACEGARRRRRAEALQRGHRIARGALVAGERRERGLVGGVERAPRVDRPAPVARELAAHGRVHPGRKLDRGPAAGRPQRELAGRPRELTGVRGAQPRQRRARASPRGRSFSHAASARAAWTSPCRAPSGTRARPSPASRSSASPRLLPAAQAHEPFDHLRQRETAVPAAPAGVGALQRGVPAPAVQQAARHARPSRTRRGCAARARRTGRGPRAPARRPPRGRAHRPRSRSR